MPSWIPLNTILKGELVTILPLEKAHFDELIPLAKEKRIWEFYPWDCSNPERFINIYEGALADREKGSRFPFSVQNNGSGRFIGSTSFLDIHPTDRKLEIGSTWLRPEFWGTAINLECKLLLLTFCFEQLKAVRVQLKTSDNNIRSRKAIEKIGAIFEGVLRKDKIRDDGTSRNSAYYSIIDEEWQAVKERLIKKLDLKKQAVGQSR